MFSLHAAHCYFVSTCVSIILHRWHDTGNVDKFISYVPSWINSGACWIGEDKIGGTAHWLVSDLLPEVLAFLSISELHNAVAKNEQFWWATWQSNSTQLHLATGTVFHSVCQVWLSSGSQYLSLCTDVKLPYIPNYLFFTFLLSAHSTFQLNLERTSGTNGLNHFILGGCCRITPLQIAEIRELLDHYSKEDTTLSISQ